MINDIDTYNTTFEEEGVIYDVQITVEVTEDGEILDHWLDWVEPSDIGSGLRTEFREMAVSEYSSRVLRQ